MNDQSVTPLALSASPHIHTPLCPGDLMRDVLLALCPTVVVSVILFGWRALLLIAVCVGGCVAAEFVTRKLLKRPNTIGDLSAVVTGCILALNLPVTLPPYIALIGAVAAIVVVKQLFGGLGQNFVNPAAAARVILLVSFPAQMSRWVEPFYYRTVSLGDAVTTATPLVTGDTEYLRLFLGVHGGCIGETCALTLLIGGVYHMLRRVISPVIPLCFLGTLAGLTWLLGGDGLAAVLSGGALLGAFFMATDYVTSPVTFGGKFVFGIGCGLITVLIRRFGALSEGVSYAIVLMNILTPHIERLTMPRAFGAPRKSLRRSKKSKEGAAK